MKLLRTSALLAALALTLVACKSETKNEAPLPSGTIEAGAVTATATVENLDLANRLVTLRGPDGISRTAWVDERVKRLSEVKKGDHVSVTYYESLAYEVKKPGDGAAGVDVLEAGGRAGPSQQPGAAAAQMVTVTVTIKAIDKAHNSITFMKADGTTTTVVVRHPEKLQHVKVGDLVEFTYTQAVAITLDPVGKY